MGEVTRLPVQHKKKPHCPKCAAPLPSLAHGVDLYLSAEFNEYNIVGVELLIRCKCGAEWCLYQLAVSRENKDG